MRHILINLCKKHSKDNVEERKKEKRRKERKKNREKKVILSKLYKP